MSARSGMFATAGAMGSAVLSSACCWLPLMLLGLGVSAGGLGAWFVQYRTLFLSVTGVLLALSFYLVYRPVTICEEGSACATSRRGAGLATKVMLWISVVFVAAFAAFPRYAGALISGSTTPIVADSGTQLVTIGIDGMTCEACAVMLATELENLPGVREASVAYEDATATLLVDGQSPPDDIAVDEVVTGLGYRRRQ